MKRIYRRGLWQIISIVLWGIFCFVFVGGCVFIAIDLYYEFAIKKVVVLALLAVILLPYLVYNLICLFRSYIEFTDSEIKVTANVKRNSLLVYKDQNAFTLQYAKIQGLYLTMHTPNDSRFMRFTQYFITLVLQTDNNNRYITLHYHSDKQKCLIIDLLLDKVEQKTGKRLSNKCGQELLDEFNFSKATKPKDGK